jgi:hypothetical protein
LTDAYAQEMARAKVLCIGCGGSSPDSFFQTHAPYIWNTLPTTEQLSVNLTDYIVNRVVGKKAEFAGDDLKGQTRKLGIVHFETDPPSYTELNDLLAKCGPRVGYSPAADEQYVFDIGKFPERATTIIAKMKAAGVTTVLFLGDFIMPRYLTTQATAQNYYPEWIVTGTALTDLSVFGRQYDQAQWKHAFGLSNLPLRLPREQNDSWRLHQWYWGTAPAAENTNGVLYSPIAEAMLGIHMAGPNLNPETFKKGMFNYPVSGGGPTTPQISYGDHGYFKLQDANTCDFTGPRPDYASYDDSVEIWWDTTASGADEQGKEGQGMMRYSDNGKRYAPGTMPKTDVHAFKVENSQTKLDQPAPADTPPQYPSPPRPG